MSRAFLRLASVVLIVLPSLAAPAAAADADATQAVEQLANLAYEQHAAGQYAESIATYLKAYELARASELLLNVATIYDRKLHEGELAAEYYRRYIRSPDASPDLVKRATERLGALKRDAALERDAKVPPAAPAPPAPPLPAASLPSSSPPLPLAAPATPPAGPEPAAGPSPWRTAGVVLGASGLAGVLASMALGFAAKSENDAADVLCSGSACRTEAGVHDAHVAGSLATASTVAFVAGLALVAAGGTMVLAAPREVSPAVALLTIRPQVDRTGGVMTVGARF